MTMRWIGTGRSARGAPGPRRLFRLRPLGLILLALAGLAQTGCQSGFFGPCGSSPCGGACRGVGPCNYLKGLRDRVFNRGARLGTPIGASVVSGGAGCCGESAPMSMGGEAPLEFGSPTVVAPGGGPSLPAPPVDSTPLDLSPAPIEKERPPSAAPDSSTGSVTPSGTKSSAGRASYEAARPRNSLGENVARAVVSTPEPASRSARGADPASESWLDNLPPLSIPRDESRNELPEPAPLAAAETAAVKPATLPDAPATTEPPATSEVSVAPGIRRFVALEPKLSGGSLPTTAGLDWLAEKGYKTILDLRETSQVQPSFIEDVANRGMRYVALPVGLKKMDAEHVARFNLEMTLSDARPLYFCDTDGTRSGALWYIRRLTVDGVDAQVAKHEADELGLSDQEFWAATNTYLNGLKPTQSPAPAPAPATVPSALAPTDALKSAPSAAAEPQPAPIAASQPATTSLPAETITEVAQESYESQKTLDSRPHDTTVWRTCAAMVVTGLGVPLAYWSRSSLDSLRSQARASLSGPERQSKSLPPASGE
ncbi:Predicted phosphohydrolase, protein tyrosine phosphatase (PTP) superfamily, DUF442 family [Singulisphaera sp. GP187]|nr:Predicted phosphohydrolase, protein tyrosine phosphatase (PTP) superfamily, DUF442 family [Singulisphaera sp. GP187]